jgi:hypothetical protein
MALLGSHSHILLLLKCLQPLLLVHLLHGMVIGGD